MVRILALSAALWVAGCAPWTLPQDDPVVGGDTRNCARKSGCIDVAIAMDTSASTAAGLDEEGGFSQSAEAGPESKLWVALEGLDDSVGALDPARVAVALLGFAGLEKEAPAAWIEASLTNDVVAVRKAAARMRTRGAGGMSCYSCAVQLAASVLAKSETAGRCSVILVVGDAEPTLPGGPDDPEGSLAALRSALLDTGIRHSVFIVLDVRDAPAQRLRRAVAAAKAEVVSVDNSVGVRRALEGAVQRCG